MAHVQGQLAPAGFLRDMERVRELVFCSVLCIAGIHPARAQRDSNVYRLHAWVDASLCVAGIGGTRLGLDLQEDRGKLSEELLLSLDESRVPAFDRCALRIDPTGQDKALGKSDLVLNIAAGAPLLLGLDRRVRKEWLTLATLYVESALLTGGVQTLTTSAFPRYRPIAYISNATLDQRTDNRNSNAFYSGHTANTAVATFFMAKVLDDLHPELGGKRWFLYGAATIPPALVGYYRIQGGKHFLSDVIVGAVLGGAAGVLVPHLHRRTRTERLSAVPLFFDGGAGIALAWRP
jgi:hypothetical protein